MVVGVELEISQKFRLRNYAVCMWWGIWPVSVCFFFCLISRWDGCESDADHRAKKIVFNPARVTPQNVQMWLIFPGQRDLWFFFLCLYVQRGLTRRLGFASKTVLHLRRKIGGPNYLFGGKLYARPPRFGGVLLPSSQRLHNMCIYIFIFLPFV